MRLAEDDHFLRSGHDRSQRQAPVPTGALDGSTTTTRGQMKIAWHRTSRQRLSLADRVQGGIGYSVSDDYSPTGLGSTESRAGVVQEARQSAWPRRTACRLNGTNSSCLSESQPGRPRRPPDALVGHVIFMARKLARSSRWITGHHAASWSRRATSPAPARGRSQASIVRARTSDHACGSGWNRLRVSAGCPGRVLAKRARSRLTGLVQLQPGSRLGGHVDVQVAAVIFRGPHAPAVGIVRDSHGGELVVQVRGVLAPAGHVVEDNPHIRPPVGARLQEPHPAVAAHVLEPVEARGGESHVVKARRVTTNGGVGAGTATIHRDPVARTASGSPGSQARPARAGLTPQRSCQTRSTRSHVVGIVLPTVLM